MKPPRIDPLITIGPFWFPNAVIVPPPMRHNTIAANPIFSADSLSELTDDCKFADANANSGIVRLIQARQKKMISNCRFGTRVKNDFIKPPKVSVEQGL